LCGLKKLALLVFKLQRGVADADGVGGLTAEGDFDAIDAVNRGIAGRGAAESGYDGVGHETHVHEVVLYRIRQMESYDNPAFPDIQFTQHAHLPDSVISAAERQNL
jgi:hypothetical protein